MNKAVWLYSSGSLQTISSSHIVFSIYPQFFNLKISYSVTFYFRYLCIRLLSNSSIAFSTDWRFSNMETALHREVTPLHSTRLLSYSCHSFSISNDDTDYVPRHSDILDLVGLVYFLLLYYISHNKTARKVYLITQAYYNLLTSCTIQYLFYTTLTCHFISLST